MIIKLRETKPDRRTIQRAIERTIKRSRFVINWIEGRDHDKAGPRWWGGDIRILGVRLKVKRPYWGNGCEIGDRPMMRRGWTHESRVTHINFLMAADWVEFNDLLNDVLDELDVHALVFSRTVVLRKGKQRRWRYIEKMGKNAWGVECMIWDKNGTPLDFTQSTLPGCYPMSLPNPDVTVPDPPGYYRGIYDKMPVYKHDNTIH